MITRGDDFLSRLGETPFTAVEHKISKCYEATGDIVSRQNAQEEVVKNLSHCVDEMDEKNSECFKSYTLLISHTQYALDQSLERIAKMEKFIGKIIEQNNHFSEELSRIIKLVESLQGKIASPKASLCPACNGVGEIIKDSFRMDFELGPMRMRRDALGRFYETCSTCKGTGSVIQ